jgi:outer membrane protein
MKTFKSLLLTVALVCCGALSTHAQIGGQKFAYVDSDYILSNIPEYADAQEELNALSTKWENEVKAIYTKVSEMYKKYQTEMVLLSEDQKHAREQEIINKEQEAKNLQMQYFGSEGQLYQKQTELIQPIQEKIYTALTELAQTKGYTFIFDLASGTSILYASEKVDVSDDVLDQLSNVMQTVRREDRKRANAAAGTGSKSGSVSPKSGSTGSKSGGAAPKGGEGKK